MQIYVHRNSQQLGPYSVAEVSTRLADGTFSRDDNAWCEGMSTWEPLSSFKYFRETEATQTEQRPPLPTQTRPQQALALDSLGPYARSTLQANETPLYRTVIHPVVMIGCIVAAALLALLCWPMAIYCFSEGHFFLGLLLLLPPIGVALLGVITVKTSELLITDRRVIIKVGWLQRRTLEMFISKIESVRVGQGVFGRMWGYGDVVIRGTGGSAELFKNIAAPIEFRNAIQRVQTAA
jgi:uncharacterized membrane protein YdbT with pleckstrin-like domain